MGSQSPGTALEYIEERYMMEMIKRHAFEVALAAIVAVVVLAVGLGAYLAYGRETARLQSVLNSARKQAQDLLGGTLFSEPIVKKMGQQVDRRKREYEDLMQFLRTQSAARKPLVANLFPKSTDLSLRQAFKAEYDQEIARLMATLGAVKPVLVKEIASAKAQERLVVSDESRQARMFADPKRSFVRPDWVDKSEAPGLEEARKAQEDIWLMQDIVSLVANANDEIIRSEGVSSKAIGWSPIKELVVIRIGADAEGLPGTKMAGGAGRYRPAVAAGATGAAPTRPGGPSSMPVWQRPGVRDFYNVLPFRLSVVVDARYFGEVVRRLKDRETFINVKAWTVSPIVTEVQLARHRDLSATSLEDYGRKEGDPPRVVRDALVLLDVAGESLAWTLEGGRVTAAESSVPRATATATDTAKPAAPGASAPAKTGK